MSFGGKKKRHKLSAANINAKDTCLGEPLWLPSNYKEGREGRVGMPGSRKRNTDYEDTSQTSDQVMANKPLSGDLQKQTIKKLRKKIVNTVSRG